LEWKLSKLAEKAYVKAERKVQERFAKALDKVPDGDIKPLKGTENKYRLRVGGYRLLFFYTAENEFVVYSIGSRGGIYKGGE
jgi:mRNA interferase RelE/StbE